MRLKITWCLLLAAGLLYSPIASAEMMFNYLGFRANTLVGLPRWTRVIGELPQQLQSFRDCDLNEDSCTSPGVRRWRDFMGSISNLPRMKQIEEVNRFVNQWPYIIDDKAWGRSDYWATPQEFIDHSGDCEDYSILKFVTLRELGVPENDLRIVVVRDVVRDLAHAVLAVRVEGEFYILDSLFDAVLTDAEMIQYTPYYSVNTQARWTYIPPLQPANGRR